MRGWGDYQLCYLSSCQDPFLHPVLKGTAWHIQTPHHPEQHPLLCVQQAGEMTCSHSCQPSSKPLQMFSKLPAGYELNAGISWKVIPGCEAAHKIQPPTTPPVVALRLAAFLQGNGWKNSSVPHHSPILLA